MLVSLRASLLRTLMRMSPASPSARAAARPQRAGDGRGERRVSTRSAHLGRSITAFPAVKAASTPTSTAAWPALPALQPHQVEYTDPDGFMLAQSARWANGELAIAYTEGRNDG